MLSQRAFSFRSVTFNEIWHWKELLHCGEEALWNTEQLLSPEGEKKWHLENVALKKARLGLKKKKNKHKNKISPENSSLTTLLSTPGIWVCDLLLLSHCLAVAVHGKRLVCFSGSIPREPQVTQEQLLKYFRYNIWSDGRKSWEHDFFFFFVFSHHWVRINIYQPLALKSLLTIPNLNPKKSVKLLKSFSSSYEMLARIFRQEGEWDSDLNLTFNLLSSPWTHWFAVAVFYPCLLGLVLTNISSTGPCSWWCADLWKNKSCSLNPPPNT